MINFFRNIINLRALYSILIVFSLCNSNLIYGSAIRENVGAFVRAQVRTSEGVKSILETAPNKVSQAPSFTYSQENVSCYGGSDGTINVIIVAPDGTETFLWSDDSTITTSNRNGLSMGSYTVTVTNSTGSASQTIIITQPLDALTGSLTSQTNVLCFGQPTGSVVITPAGGTLPYTITPSQTGLASGVHTFTVTDTNGCTTTIDATITQPAATVTIATTQFNILCFGAATGTATATPSGGTGAYSYSWNTSPVQSTSTATGLAAGSYTVTVKDANGCPATASMTITQPAAAVTVGTSQVNVLCFGSATGTATATPSGGTGAYSYSWNTSPVQSTSTATGLAAGSYTVTVKDANGCPATASMTITQPAAAVTIATTQVNILCFGAATGTATATPSGGAGAYSYSWNTSPVQSTSTATGLAAGSYTVTVKDANGCTTVANVTITQPPYLSISAISSNTPICQGSTLNLSVTATGGTTAYSYSWTGPKSFTSFSQNPSIVYAAPFASGIYAVSVTDANGCSASSNAAATINPTPTVTATPALQAICSGISTSIALSGSVAGTTYSWTAALTSGTATGFANGTGNNIAQTLINSSSAPATVTYTITPSANGCSGTAITAVVTVNTDATLTLTSAAGTKSQIICINTPLTNITYSIGGSGTGATISSGALPAGVTGNFSAGVYTISGTPTVAGTFLYTLTTAGPCSQASQSGTITSYPLPSVNALSDYPFCSGITTSSIAVSGPVPGTTFNWVNNNPAIGLGANGTGNIPSFTTNNSTTAPISALITVTQSANGCNGPPTTFTITVNPAPVLNTPLTASVCSGMLFSYSPSSLTTGTTFGWNRSAKAGISNPANSGTGNISETLTNLTSNAISVTYSYTLTANGCSNTQNLIVTVVPAPTLSSTLNPSDICSNTLFSYVPAFTISGTTATWSRAVISNISNPAGSGSGSISETLVNTSSSDVAVVYLYTLNAAGCINTQNITFNVKPSPALSSPLAPVAICSNSTFSYSPTSSTSGTTFTWTRAAIAGINSNLPGGGSNNPNEILINSTGNPIPVSYLFTLRAGACQNTQSVVVMVNPTTTATVSGSAMVCLNAPNPNITFAGTGGPIPYTFTYNINGAGNQTVTTSVGDSVTVSVPTNVLGAFAYNLVSVSNADGCSQIQTGTATVTVTLLPTGTISGTTTLCQNSAPPLVTFTGSNGLAPYSFVYQINGGANLTATTTSGNTITVSVPTGTAGTFIYSLISVSSAAGCSQVQAGSATITLKAIPTVRITPASSVICNGGSTTLSAAGAATYSWSPATGLSATSGPSVTASPTSTTTYTVTGTAANGCTNTATITVTVNPLPVVTVTPAAITICQGNSTTLTASGASTYGWNPNADLSSSSGTSVTATSLNTTTYTVTGTDGNGCVNTQAVTVTVKPVPVLTNPIPSPATVCSNIQFNYTPVSSVAGTSFSWTRAVVAGISNSASSGTGSISENLVNTTTNPIGVTYIYMLTANGCPNPVTFSVVIVVIPAPTVNVSASPSSTICAGGSVTLTSSSSLVSLPLTLLTQNFNAAPVGWTTTNNSTGGTTTRAAWTSRPNNYPEPTDGTTISSNDATNFYLSDSRYQNGTTTVTYLTSPAINISGYTTLSLDFYHYFYYQGTTNEAARVQVSTDGSTWTPVATYISTQGGATSFAHPIINLSGFEPNPLLYIRFYYYCGGHGRYWAIDNVSVTGTSATNPVISWTSSPAGFTSNVANPPATVSPAVTTTYTATYTDPVADPLTLCPGTNSVTVTVNPNPLMTSPGTASVCSGGTVNIPLTASVPSTFTWVAASNVNVTGEITTTQTTSTLINTLSTASTSPQTVVYTVTPTAITGSCAGTPQTVNVIVNPAPSVNQPANQTLCSEANTTAITFAGSAVAGTTYNWTNDTPSIGLAASGTGNIASFTAFNNGSSPITATLVVTPVANGCPGPTRTFTITVNPIPAPTVTANYCAVLNKIQLTATGGGTYLWSTGDVTNPILVNVAGNYSVTVTTGGCSAIGYLGVSNELVVNGSFTNGNVGFTSDYAYKPDLPGLVPAVQGELYDDSGNNAYSITTNGQNVHINFWGTDHTNNATGAKNFMAVNGHGTLVIWKETVTVIPGATYYFSAWATSLNSVGPYANLQFSVNGTTSGLSQTSTGVLPSRPQNNNAAPWTRFYGNWTAPVGVTTAVISVVDLETALNGNDFGVDDISFGTLDPASANIAPSSNGPICISGTITLNPNVTGGKSPYHFTWTGPNGFTSTDSIPIITNTTTANSGLYTLSLVDGYGCPPVTGSVSVTVNALPVCSITGVNNICPNSTGNVFTGPAGMVTYSWSITNGTIVGSPSGQTVTVTAGSVCSTPVTLSLTINNANCSNTCTKTVNLQDITAWTTPEGSLNRALDCSDAAGLVNAQALVPAATSSCTPVITPVKTSGLFVPGACPQSGTYTNTWTFNDGCGNPVSVVYTQVITITDSTPPIWTTLSGALDQSLSCTDAAGLIAALAAIPVASDPCVSPVTYSKISDITTAGACAGTYKQVRTWTAKDNCNNVSIPFTQTIQVNDNVPPVWDQSPLALNATFDCSNTGGLAAALVLAPTARDACGSGVVIALVNDVTTAGGCSWTYTRIREWTATDGCMNVSARYRQTIIVQDITAPTWATPPGALDVILECSDAAGLAVAQSLFPVASDLCDASITNLVKSSGPLVAGACPQSGSYINTWTVTDDCGNQSAVYTQVITLQDNTPPNIIRPSDQAISCSDSFAPSATGTATATDNCDLAPIVTYTDVQSPGSCPSDFTINRTWKATDKCGNTTTSLQRIYIQDVDPPVITCLVFGNQTVNSNSGNHYIEPDASWNASATDACSSFTLTATLTGATTGTALATLNGASFNPGMTTVTWNATDACGNKSSCSFTVTVNAGADLAISIASLPVTATLGQNLTYTIWVKNLGPSAATNVLVSETLPAGMTLVSFSSSVGAWDGLTTWNIGNLVFDDVATLTITVAVSPTHCASFTNTVSVTSPTTDPVVANNTATLVTPVIDTTNPVITTCPMNRLISGCSTSDITDPVFSNAVKTSTYALFSDELNQGVASDNCGITSVTYQDVASGTNPIVVMRTWTLSDAAGNTSTCTQHINVKDSTPPTFTAPVPYSVCVENLNFAAYISSALKINPDPDYYLFKAGSTLLDLDPVGNNFSDNCCAVNTLVIHWRLDFADTPNPSPPPAVLTHPSITGTGQPSAYGSDIQIPGDGVNFTTVVHTITYWLVDCNGNSSAEYVVNITVKPRPNLNLVTN